MQRRNCPAEDLIVNSSSSFSGCAILEILPPVKVSCNSLVIFAMVIHQKPYYNTHYLTYISTIIPYFKKNVHRKRLTILHEEGYNIIMDFELKKALKTKRSLEEETT